MTFKFQSFEPRCGEKHSHQGSRLVGLLLMISPRSGKEDLVAAEFRSWCDPEMEQGSGHTVELS